MDRKLKLNYIMNLLYQLLILAIPIITMPYLSRVLTPEGAGLNSFTHSVVYIFVYAGCYGISLYGQKEIASHQNDIKMRSKIFKEIFILNFISLVFSTIVYTTVITLFFGPEHFIFLVLQGITLFAYMLDVTWFFQGIEEFKKIVLRNLIIKLGGLVLIFLLVKSSDDVGVYIAISSGVIFVSNLSLIFYLPKYIVKTEEKLQIGRHFKPALLMFVPQFAVFVYAIVDKTMIEGLIQSDAEVGFYDYGEKITKMLINVMTALSTVVIPRVVKYFFEGRQDLVKAQINTSFKLIWFLSIPITIGISLVSIELIPLFLGSEYTQTIYVIQALSPVIIIFSVSNLIGAQYLVPTNQFNKYTICVLSGIVLNIILNIFFVPQFRAVGAAYATIIAESFVVILEIIFVRKQLELKQIILSSVKYLVAGLWMFPLCTFIGSFNLAPLVTIVLKVISCVVSYVVILLILRDDLIYEKIHYYYRKIFKKKQKNE